MELSRTFASDNYSGVHPEIMEALTQANRGHARSYGEDEYCASATQKFKALFHQETAVYFVYNGTGANVLGLQALTKSYNSIICSDLAHINVDESTAPEKFLGCKLLTIPTINGKIVAEQVEAVIKRLGDQHHPQAKAISISQPTEYATVYSIEELNALSAVAKKYDLLFHMDGSRIANAAVSLHQDFKAFTVDVGVDVLSFGGTKNGMMFGEAILILNPTLANDFKFIRKQGMQLHSKMRFIGCQFDALLTNDLWKRNAQHTNAMAQKLKAGLSEIKEIQITQSVDANGVFAVFPSDIIEDLQKEIFFYVWDETKSEVRLMCSFDTQEDDIDRLINKAKELISH